MDVAGRDVLKVDRVYLRRHLWNNLYRYRVIVERTINIFKDSFTLDSGKSLRTSTVKADLFLAGIAQLVGVLLADALHKPQFIKSVRRLIA